MLTAHSRIRIPLIPQSPSFEFQEDDDDLSIRCDIQVMAMLTPDIQHSFTVPVDIPCRNEPKRSAIVESPPMNRFCAYSAQNVPRRFDCFVKLERLSPTQNLSDIRGEPEEQMDTTIEVKRETFLSTDTEPQQPCQNEEDPMEGTETAEIKVEYHLEAPPTDDDDEEEGARSHENSYISSDISRSRTISTESSFDIKVENSMRLPVMETPPPDVSPPLPVPMVNVPTANLSMSMTKCHKPNKVVQLRQRLEKGKQISDRPPTPVEDPPNIPALQPPAAPPVRPFIKLRNINELLDNPHPMLRLQQMVDQSCDRQAQLYHQQQMQPQQQQPVSYDCSPAAYYQQVPNTQRVPTISAPAFSPHSAYASYPSPLYPVLHQPAEAQSQYQPPQFMAPAAPQSQPQAPQQQQFQRMQNRTPFMHQQHMQTIHPQTNTFNPSNAPMPNPHNEGPGMGPWGYVLSASNMFSI